MGGLTLSAVDSLAALNCEANQSRLYNADLVSRVLVRDPVNNGRGNYVANELVVLRGLENARNYKVQSRFPKHEKSMCHTLYLSGGGAV
jgi:hypothetical protein